jgi:choline dehydrogenase-like flavoprotein
MHRLPQARNSIAYSGRPRCQACGTCHVCPTGAKASIDLTHFPAAEATGNVRVMVEATALRLETGRPREITTAVYAHPDRIERRVSARIFVLAAGGIENVRLLLLSRSSEFPDGLANRSGLVGRRFMAQPSVDVIGHVTHNVYPYRIGFSTAMSKQFALGPARATRAGFYLEFLNSAGPKPDELAASSGLTGDDLRRYVMDSFGKRLGIRIYCDHLPERSNTVSLSRRARDYFGNPGPHVTYHLARYEQDALEAAKHTAAKILQAVGATRIAATPLSPAAHQIGTHRMGTEPRDSVVGPNLRAHDVDNLYLVGSGSFVTASAAPPTLTIAALALRAAEHIAARVRGTQSDPTR